MSASYETEEINTKYEKLDVEQGIENPIKKDIPQTIELEEELEEELENPLQEDIPQAIEVEEQEAVEISLNEERDISFNRMVAKERASIHNCVQTFFCFAFVFVGFILFEIFLLRK